MKHLWLFLCTVTLMLSSCVVGPDSFAHIPTPVPSPTPDHSGYADMIKEFDSAGSSQELFEYPSGRLITVISMGDLVADSWLLGWAIEAALNDMLRIAGEGSPDDEGFPLFVWLYANGFAASELRCAEGRHELGDLLKTFATKVREERPDTSLHHMVVANTLWKQLPEGEADCSTYMADLPAEKFLAVLVDHMLQFGMGEFPAGVSRESVEQSELEDTRTTAHTLFDHYSGESTCAELKEIAREALADAPPSPARARFDAADRKAFAGSAFGYLCELSEEVGPRESGTHDEFEAAEFLIARFTEFGYSPEVQAFGGGGVMTGEEFAGPPSRNIILELPGRGEGVVILGAHYDTTPDSVGANDNASGIGVLLVLAERLARPPWSDQAVSVFPFTLRFIAFGSEEIGLRGSWHYVDQLTDAELDDIRVMINLDSVGSGTTLSAVGNPWLIRHVSEAAAREDVLLTTFRRGTSGGYSDNFSFGDAWVPTISFSGDDKSRINSPYDTIQFINPALLGDTVVLVLDLLVSLEDLQCGCR